MSGGDIIATAAAAAAGGGGGGGSKPHTWRSARVCQVCPYRIQEPCVEGTEHETTLLLLRC